MIANFKRLFVPSSFAEQAIVFRRPKCKFLEENSVGGFMG